MVDSVPGPGILPPDPASRRGHHLPRSCQAPHDPRPLVLLGVAPPASAGVAASPALVLREGRGLVDHPHEEERRAGDDPRALPGHVLQEGVVEERVLAGGKHALEDLEVPQDGPQRLDPDLVQGDLRHL